MDFLHKNIIGAVVIEQRCMKKSGENKGKYPLKYRLTYQRKQIYIAVGLDVSLVEWQRITDKDKPVRDQQLVKTKKYIQDGLNELEKKVIEITNGSEYSHEKLLTLLKKGKREVVALAFNDRIEELQAKGQIGTSYVYTNARNFIQRYDPSVTFAKINPKWLEKLESFGIDNEGMNYTSFAMYARSLRAIFNTAIQEGRLMESSYPFARNENEKAKYFIREGEGTKSALTAEQIAQIARYKTDRVAVDRYRNLFLLSFALSGLNFQDLLTARWSDIKQNELHIIRAKTKRTNAKIRAIKLPIEPETWQLIDKLNPERGGEYILPYMISNPKPLDVKRIVKNHTRACNKALQLIARDLNISELSSYTARHSAATLMQQGGVSVAGIQGLLGQATEKATSHYLKGFEQSQRQENIQKLTSILSNGNGKKRHEKRRKVKSKRKRHEKV